MILLATAKTAAATTITRATIRTFVYNPTVKKTRVWSCTTNRYPIVRSLAFRNHSTATSTTTSTTTTTTSIRSKKNGSTTCNVAIVGTGPSGFYTAKYLLAAFDKKKLQQLLQQQQQQQQHSTEHHNNNNNDDFSCDDGFQDCTIDLIEKMPTPYGLVRYGVAPDHPEVKNVEHDFAKFVQENTTKTTTNNDRIQFWGNVTVGQDVTVRELRQWYDIVVLAYGCESDRKLGIPGEDELDGIVSAREFVAWYNGHPSYEHIGEHVARALSTSSPKSSSTTSSSSSSSQVVVIGQGNVALDCARILSKGAKGLVNTDIASRALSVIGNDGVHLVTVVGRRGHVQGAFTIKVRNQKQTKKTKIL